MFRNRAICILLTGLALAAPVAWAQGSSSGAATIRRMSLLKGSSLELEIAASGPITPRSKIISSPDRLVIDFPNALPAKGLRNLEINRDDVTDARVGLFSSNPPVTRIVLDLKSPQSYQLFAAGNTVVVKFGAKAPDAASANATESMVPETIVSIERPGANESIPAASNSIAEQKRITAPSVAPRMEVLFENGLLSIRSNKASMAEVLSEVHLKTGAEIIIPPGAESEQVFTNLGPGAPKEVLTSLLNGSHFNFIVIGSERDPGGIRQVVLTPKEGGAAEAVVYPCGSSQPAMAQGVPEPQQTYAPPPEPMMDPNEGIQPAPESPAPPQNQ